MASGNGGVRYSLTRPGESTSKLREAPPDQFGREDDMAAVTPGEKTLILQRVAAVDNLPSPSPLVLRLLNVAADEQCSVRDLAAIIEQDPGLTTGVLKLVNSAYYAPQRRAASIDQAILLIGFKKLRTMALCISLRDAFPFGKVGGLDYEHFWKTSLYRALIAQGLAGLSPVGAGVCRGDAFTSGLIAEIGMLMLFHVAPEHLKERFPGPECALEDVLSWEERYLGVHHREVGRIILKHWQFPDEIVASQQYFGAEAICPERAPLARIVECARRCGQLLFGLRSDFEWLGEMLPILGVDEERVGGILSESFARVEEAAESLRLHVSCGQDVVVVMEKANRALARINSSLENSLERIVGVLSGFESGSDAASPSPVVLPDVARERRRTLENVLEAVAHEVRNPLMAIGGFAQRMARNLSGNGDVRRYAHIIAEESSRLERALNEAFEFLRDTELEFVPRDVTSMLEESVAHIAVLLEEKRIDLEFDDGRIPQLAMVDDLALRKAFQHLLMLLVRLTPADAGKIAIRMDFSAAGHELVIILRGDGARMPADLHAMLTGLDFSGKHFGSGFAALFARKTLESHQGRLEVHGGEDHVELAIFLPLLPRHRH